MTEQTKQLYDFFIRQGFAAVGKESYPVFQNFQHRSVLLDMTATLINGWGSALDSVYKNIDGYLCIVWFCDGSPFHAGAPFYITVLQPAQSDKPLKQVIDALYDLTRQAGLSFLLIESIEEQFLTDFQAIEGYSITTGYSDDHSEYAYKTADLRELSGGINLNKRNRLKKFFNKDNITLTPLCNQNAPLCMDIQSAWCAGRDCDYCASFAGCEKKSLAVLLSVFDERVYHGFIAYTDGAAVGYSIWEKKNSTLSFLYFGKSTVQDFFAYLIYMAAETNLTDVEYFNIGEDMGNQGLRTFKKHLGAHQLWRKYSCNYQSL
jgi:hypothetical protein